jgi:hypothetical protein
MKWKSLFWMTVFAVTACGQAETAGAAASTGEAAPAFSLPDSQGNQVALSDLVADGPAVVVFYRGHW